MSPAREFIAAPLAAPALGVALGLAADRWLTPPFEAMLAIAAVGLLSLVWVRSRVALVLVFAGLAAIHHDRWWHHIDADDVSRFAAQPAIVSLRGTLSEQPLLSKASRTEFFGPARRIDRSRTVLDVSAIALADTWQPAGGRVLVHVERDVPDDVSGLLDRHFVGDEVEVVGLLSLPQRPGNPGERDYAASLHAQHIRSELRITKGADLVVWNSDAWGIDRALATLRARLTRVLKETTPRTDTPLARALLLGDTAATDRDEWDAFARTGVIHVLAISGQHLVILAAAIWWLARLLGIRRVWAAWLVLTIIVSYALLTGGRPSALRAAVMVGMICGAVILGRSAHLANTFCLAWLVVVAVNPADALSFGSLLSFLSVFVLVWGAARWLEEPEISAAEQLRREVEPRWKTISRTVWKYMFGLYLINLILAVTNAPLIMAAQNVIPLASLIIGPPLVILTTIALLTGFAQMTFGLVSPDLGVPFGFLTGCMLHAGQWIVTLANDIPFAALYVPQVPNIWVVGFYVLLIALIAWPARQKPILVALLLGSLLLFIPRSPDNELRVTVLSVGHGGCVVIETPDGRTLLYDAGSMGGPDIVRRSIAPYLWSRGIRRIDELMISHADLDHYNAIEQLLRRFPLGQVTMSPSFATKPVPEVAELLLAFKDHAVPMRVASRGEMFRAGDVSIDVLHPPAEGPPGSENERSLVLMLTHAQHTMLLTGDLEKAGTGMVLATPSRKIHVLMAPHHGSSAAYPDAWNAWANPDLVVVSRGPRGANPANAANAWDTSTHGAITIRSTPGALLAETFRTGERRVLVRDR